MIYLSSFSKVLFPGLRIGWLAAPRPATRQLALVKQAVDLHSSTAGQFLLERFIRDGHYGRHLQRVRGEYARRRDLMDDALTGEAPAGVTWTSPQGGFYIWCRLPDPIRQSRLLAKAAEQRVSYLPGSACFADEPGANHVRLNFTFAPADEIRPGVARLTEALRAAARRLGADRHQGEATPPIV